MASPTDVWQSEDNAVWGNALASYARAVKLRSESKGKAKLAEYDRWVKQDLPLAIASRATPHITKDEYVRLVEWKLLRGQNRASLTKYANETDPKAIEEASRAAFELLRGVAAAEGRPALQQAAKGLCVIKGMGPATASVVMHVACPHAPFMSDEALMATAGTADRKGLQYRAQDYDKMADALRAKAVQLSSKTGRPWTASEVERCLFAASVVPVSAARSVPVASAAVEPTESPAALKTSGGMSAAKGKRGAEAGRSAGKAAKLQKK